MITTEKQDWFSSSLYCVIKSGYLTNIIFSNAEAVAKSACKCSCSFAKLINMSREDWDKCWTRLTSCLLRKCPVASSTSQGVSSFAFGLTGWAVSNTNWPTVWSSGIRGRRGPREWNSIRWESRMNVGWLCLVDKYSRSSDHRNPRNNTTNSSHATLVMSWATLYAKKIYLKLWSVFCVLVPTDERTLSRYHLSLSANFLDSNVFQRDKAWPKRTRMISMSRTLTRC